jgi:hypothetical protein
MMGEMAPAPSSSSRINPPSAAAFTHPSYIQTIHLIENCTYLHNSTIMAPQQQPKLQPQQQTASNSDSISDQQPVRTRISLPTLLKPMFHAVHPNPSMLKYVILKLEIHRPYGRVESSNGVAAAARPRRPAPTYPARWWDARRLVSTKCCSILSFQFLPCAVLFCSTLYTLSLPFSNTSLEASLAIPLSRLPTATKMCLNETELT